MNYLYHILLAVFFFVYGICCSQVSVIHFNSDWNNDNNFNISVLKDCDIANIMMQLEATKKEIQKEIDKIYLAKFE